MGPDDPPELEPHALTDGASNDRVEEIDGDAECECEELRFAYGNSDFSEYAEERADGG